MCRCLLVFFFNDTATTEIYTLSLHDALPISDVLDVGGAKRLLAARQPFGRRLFLAAEVGLEGLHRSEEHTSELQSRQYLVCRLLLEKKNSERDRGVYCR